MLRIIYMLKLHITYRKNILYYNKSRKGRRNFASYKKPNKTRKNVSKNFSRLVFAPK